MDAGVRAGFTASSHAARIMVPERRGLIVNISFWAAQKYIGNVIYGVAKAATDKMTADMERSGKVVVAATAAAELGVTDLDGRRPKPLNLDEVEANSVRVGSGDLFQHSVEAVEPRASGEKHERALAGNDRDAVRLAELDGIGAHGSMAAAAMHPYPLDACGGAFADHRIGHSGRSH